MCGIVGFLGGNATGAAADEQLATRMADALIARGPDSSGVWVDSERRIAFGHRRLAIIDVSACGHQPMHSRSERYVIAFNGEIYNHLLLRDALEREGRAGGWRGHSDTETLLAAFDAWGIVPAIEKLIGMFAIAVWDRDQQSLTLARDRIGEKPLYYGWQGDGRQAAFLFGSELKGLRLHPAFQHEICRGAISLQLRHNCIPAPHSIYQGIHKLGAGEVLTVSLAAPQPRIAKYWSATRIALDGKAAPDLRSPAAAVDALETLLTDAIGKQMMSDVPLGAFLSGGIDSSTVVALMQRQSARPVKTFTMGFEEETYNEAVHAKAVARHLGTDHTELYVTARDAVGVIDRLPQIYDEPFSDSSQIPTFLVAQLARQDVTVALSGDGGDELFSGYNRYHMTATLWSRLAATPMPLRRAARTGLTAVSEAGWNKIARVAGGLLPATMRLSNLGAKLHKGAGVLESTSSDDLYRTLTSHWRDPAAVVIGGAEPPTLLTGAAPDLSALDSIERMMLLDLLTYLPDDVLTKVDRAAMAVSLETRVPFLDHRVVEFAWRLPQSLKQRDGQSKWILRQVLDRHVPRELIERPKMGFGVPIGKWLRGPLRDWAAALLDESRLRREGFFDPAPITLKWKQHSEGVRDWQYDLWDVLMFQSWLESTRTGGSAAPLQMAQA